MAQILINRGISDLSSAERFLNPSLENIHNPFLMKGMEEAVIRLTEAIEKKEKICIYGDFDVDGVTGTSLLVLFFREIGIKVDYYIPDRQSEGYGINLEALKKIDDGGCRLIVTVDCGISNSFEISQAKEWGLDTIVTDHHQIPEEIPQTISILNPAQKDCPYPFKSLSGVGVAYKLIMALRMKLRENPVKKIPLPNLKKHLDLVAIGSIADIVPLFDENRIFVKYGLGEIEQTEKIGVQELKSVSNVQGAVNSFEVGFMLAPRLNAGGRIAEATSGVKLLTSEVRSESIQIALLLNKVNEERKSMQEKIYLEAKKEVDDLDDDSQKAIVLASSKWHAGIIGIVASKIAEEFHKPTVLISLDQDIGRGSSRSIPHFHIYEALKECSSVLEGFGGHKMAAGLTIKKDNIESFKDLFSKIVAQKSTPQDFIPILNIDYELPLNSINMNFIKEIDLLKPHGHSNPSPIFLTKNVSIINYILMGKEKTHIKLTFADEITSINGVGFNMAYLANTYDLMDMPFDIVHTPQVNEWNGSTEVQLLIKDIKPSTQSSRTPFLSNPDI